MTAELVQHEGHQEELLSLRKTVRDVCEAAGTAAVRALTAHGPGFDEASWDVLARQVGLAALGLPEASGGVGGLPEIAVVCEEAGRVLLPVPFLSSTVLAGQALAGSGPAAVPALARVAGGEVAALTAFSPLGVWDPAAVQLTAGRLDGGWTVDGTAEHILDGAGAALHVVAAQGPDGPDLFLVEGSAPGVRVDALPTLDLSRSQATVTFTDAPAVRLTEGGTAGQAIEPAFDLACVALAAEQVGGAQACLDLTVAYVLQRRQFGRPVGSFQAVKHTCADLLVLVETSRSALVRAVEADSPQARSEAASVAQAWCSETYRTVTAETVQLHGGIGFTWEHDAHLYFRRARADAVLLGGAAYHRERLAGLLAW
jgi:alkylation response protein AidB-like acyl-CoA dehydrogenase